jgi:hypothetical protein
MTDQTTTPPIVPDAYLGDGVYASFDGYQIWLAVNHHSNKVVALEPDVFASLIEYREKVIRALARASHRQSEEASDG